MKYVRLRLDVVMLCRHPHPLLAKSGPPSWRARAGLPGWLLPAYGVLVLNGPPSWRVRAGLPGWLHLTSSGHITLACHVNDGDRRHRHKHVPSTARPGFLRPHRLRPRRSDHRIEHGWPGTCRPPAQHMSLALLRPWALTGRCLRSRLDSHTGARWHHCQHAWPQSPVPLQPVQSS